MTANTPGCRERPSDEDDWDDFPDERGRPLYLPSLAEIAEACAELQATWSPAEERSRRAGGQRVAWQVPGVDAGHCITDPEAVRTFMGTGALIPQAGDWERSKPADAPIPFDD